MENTLFIGKVHHQMKELPSTNAFAIAWASKSRPPEGAVVQTDKQTAGRGQFGSQWLTNPGENLTLSIILYPGWLMLKQQFLLSMVAALAVHDVLLTWGLTEASIKWPNDLMLGNRKTAGILLQNIVKGHVLDCSVVGIGLNVNQTTFPAELPHATSMQLHAQRTFDLNEVTETLFGALESRYLQLKAGKSGEISAAYHQYLYGVDAIQTFMLPSGVQVQRRIKGVDAHSGLITLQEPDSGATTSHNIKGVQLIL